MESLFELQAFFWDRKHGIDRTPEFTCKVVHKKNDDDAGLLDYIKQRRKNDHER